MNDETKTKRHDAFLTSRNISQFFLWVETSVNMRERQKQRDADTELAEDSEDSYFDLILTHVVISYWGPYVFVSLTKGTQPGSAVGYCPHSIPETLWFSPDLLTA